MGATPVRESNDESDVRIRDALIAGSERALAEVYDTYGPVVYGVALHITRDQGAAEDIVQDVFVELWRRPERFDPQRAALRGWLSMLARRRGIDWVRRRRTRQDLSLTAVELASSGFEDDVLALSRTSRSARRSRICRCPYTAAPSARSKTSTPRSAASSPAGTLIPALRLDQSRRPDPQESEPSEDLRRGALEESLHRLLARGDRRPARHRRPHPAHPDPQPAARHRARHPSSTPAAVPSAQCSPRRLADRARPGSREGQRSTSPSRRHFPSCQAIHGRGLLLRTGGPALFCCEMYTGAAGGGWRPTIRR